MEQPYERDLMETMYAAEANDVEAQASMAAMHEQGSIVPEDKSFVLYWYQKAAAQGHAPSQLKLADHYSYRHVVPMLSEILSTLTSTHPPSDLNSSAASAGPSSFPPSLPSQGTGNTSHGGDGVASPQDHVATSFRWYREAAYNGDAQAQALLGFHYGTGRGVEQDDYQAFYWYYMAAKQGNVIGEYNVGCMYDERRSILKEIHQNGDITDNNGSCLDYDMEAARWYTLAAEKGFASALVNLGMIYDDGRGVPQDKNRAVSLYSKAALLGNATGQNNLAWMYDLGQVVGQDDRQALHWFRHSADNGHSSAQFCVGSMYELGIGGVEANLEEAIFWYRSAAMQHEPDALLHLKWLEAMGMCEKPTQGGNDNNDNGRKRSKQQGGSSRSSGGGGGGEMDSSIDSRDEGRRKLSDPARRFRKSAEDGDPAAQYNLGLVYEKGLGVPKDIDQAVAWYRRAAAQNHENAEERLRFYG
ncbi:hypothetical protein BGW41_006953 [Actinomortierella wolfii]|nr:hypothetical protein BGW41_006953 [Actinomortierella wolfii]